VRGLAPIRTGRFTDAQARSTGREMRKFSFG
jgi:hypothetical protein